MNGVVTDEFPTALGEYTITVDYYSIIYGRDYTWDDEVKITCFGSINR